MNCFVPYPGGMFNLNQIGQVTMQLPQLYEQCNMCAAGYENYPTCSLIQCSINTDCSGHAASVTGTVYSGCECACSAGFAGIACDRCDIHFEGYPACTPISCTSRADCNGHASSVSGTTVSGCTCTCATGFNGTTATRQR